MFIKGAIFCAAVLFVQTISAQCGCNQNVQPQCGCSQINPTIVYNQINPAQPCGCNQNIPAQPCGCNQNFPQVYNQINQPCGCNQNIPLYNQANQPCGCNQNIPLYNQVNQPCGCNQASPVQPVIYNQIAAQPCGCNQVQPCGCNRPYAVSLTVSPCPLAAAPNIPAGMTIASDNLLISGPVLAAGKLPFAGTVALEGALPACGAGQVSYACGDNVRVYDGCASYDCSCVY